MNVVVNQFFEFRKASLMMYKPRLFNKKEITTSSFIPYVVNGSFCIEIGIKAILREEKIPYSKKHYLLDLFRLLPDLEKEFLLERIISFGNSIDHSIEGLESMLNQINNNFLEFRYYFDFESFVLTNWLFIHDLIEAIAQRFSNEFGIYLSKKLGINS